MAQWIKCLLYKYKFRFWAPHKKPGMVVHIYNPSTGRWRQTHWASIVTSWQASGSLRDPISKNKMQHDRHWTLISDLYMCMHVHVHVHKHTQVLDLRVSLNLPSFFWICLLKWVWFCKCSYCVHSLSFLFSCLKTQNW